MSVARSKEEETEEVEQLRARVAELEAELIRVEDWANRTVGAAQQRLYWLDRWHLDLNALMERPGAGELRGLLRAMRWLYRVVRRAMRSLPPSA